MNNKEVFSLYGLLEKIKRADINIEFEQVMNVIEKSYHYQPSMFSNGDLFNDAGTNEGSCKIFYFAQLNELNQEQTLSCFGRYYREDVMVNPTGNDHGNIRNFMKTGWSGIEFKSQALRPI